MSSQTAPSPKLSHGAPTRQQVFAGHRTAPFFLIPLSFCLIEVFSFAYLLGLQTGEESPNYWPLAFGLIWSVLLTGLVRILPGRASVIAYGVSYFTFLIYAVVQTGYFLLFEQMLWISDFQYASEGSDYFSVLLSYPIHWWLSVAALGGLGLWNLLRYPAQKPGLPRRVLAGLTSVLAIAAAVVLPQLTFLRDSQIRYAGSDYGRSQSREAAYENMFNTYRLYQVCGIFQTAVKDVYANVIYPVTPAYMAEQSAAGEEIDAYFQSRDPVEANQMTGLLKDKNVILVLMESMDDWMIGEHTPTLVRLMSEGINFTRFYTPGYGGIRTFNTEFCINTGSFLSSAGGYAFDYVTNAYPQSLANQLREENYSAYVYHYNDPSFYSRGVFSPAMGYEGYLSYQDFVGEDADELYDDQLLFDNAQLSSSFFREGKTLNFIITRSAHLSYKYNEVLSYWGLKKYPEYRGLTGNEETDCAYLKARLVDDMFARLLTELEERGQLENTVIIGVTDHYTYGYKDEASLLELSGVNRNLLLERTPCFIWSPGLEAQTVNKLLNTADLLPTVLNLLGVESEYSYIGHDAFDSRYEGFVPFSDGSWIRGDAAYDASEDLTFDLQGGDVEVTESFRSDSDSLVQSFVDINNQILESDYYKSAKTSRDS